MTKKQIQIMRGISILLVVIHHTLSNIDINKFENIIYYINRVHVVIFFLISGFLFQLNVKKYKVMGTIKFYCKKFKELAVPYIFWSLTLYLGVKLVAIIPGTLDILNKLGFYPKSLLTIIIDTIIFKDYYVQVLWFVYVLFWIFLINYKIKDKFINFKYICVLVLIGFMMKYRLDLSFIILKFLKHFPNFIVGRFIYLNLEKIKLKINSINCIFGFVIVIILNLLDSSKFNSFTSQLYSEITSYITGWIAFIIFWYIAKKIEKINAGKLLIILGNYSYAIYLMHYPYIIGVLVLVMKEINIAMGVTILITTILGILLPIFIRKFIINKCKFLEKLMLG